MIVHILFCFQFFFLKKQCDRTLPMWIQWPKLRLLNAVFLQKVKKGQYVTFWHLFYYRKKTQYFLPLLDSLSITLQSLQSLLSDLVICEKCNVLSTGCCRTSLTRHSSKATTYSSVKNEETTPNLSKLLTLTLYMYGSHYIPVSVEFQHREMLSVVYMNKKIILFKHIVPINSKTT